MANIYTDLENGYDGIANEYERWCTGDDNYEPSLKFYLEYLEAHNGPFLELGIGTGRIALEAIKSHPKHIVGVDVSANMLKNVKKNIKSLRGIRSWSEPCSLLNRRSKTLNSVKNLR